MDVSSSRCSMTLVIPDWDHSAAAFDAAPFNMLTPYGNALISPAADDMWSREQCFVPAPLATQQQLVLSPSMQDPAPFAGCQMYQQQFSAHHAATAPLPGLAPVCTAAARSQPLQLQQQLMSRQLMQQQAVVTSSPILSADHTVYDDGVIAYGDPHANGTGSATATAAEAGRRARRSSFCVEHRQLPPVATVRQRPASFSAGTRFAQQQQLAMVGDGSQLVAAPTGSTSFSNPLPMLLPQPQPLQQEQMLCQDMSFTGQLPTAVYEPSLDNSAMQGSMLDLSVVPVPATLQQQQQQQQQVQAQQQQQQQLLMLLGGADVGSMSVSPPPGLMLPEMISSNQQQQLCMPLGAATVCSNSPLPAVPLDQVRPL
ncbi:hypothetical protein COO60DRAFT_1694673 [Scenedesmus sp. NREL 46B-D3]|nr:hypothetical protein COO60DRAFT_1694673 [Scenedesmus sp. NREL 46B-D3]